MEQRRLRLGDILDDYCPRERRLTNHVVVAMIEEDVKQTRCTTCDAEHVYKGGKAPRRRKKDTPAALYKEVLAGMTETEPSPVLTTGHLANAGPSGSADPSSESAEPPPVHLVPVAEPASARYVSRNTAPAEAVSEAGGAEPSQSDAVDVEDGPVHRPLIRAQLPRVEGHKEERRLPDFTIRQPGRGGGGFRSGDARTRQPRAGGQGGGNGGDANRSHGGPRFAGPRPGGPGRSQPGRGGPSAGFRGAGQPRQGGPKKRSR